MTSDYQKFCNTLLINDEMYYKKVNDKIQLFSYGCPDSIWDLETIADCIDTSKLKKPVVFIDTCCAIDLQEDISKRVTDRVTKIFKDADIYITGCGISYDKEYYKDKGIVLDNNKKFDFQNSYKNIIKDNFNPVYSVLADHINGYIKISDGCDFNCTYCTIKKVRPHHMFSYSEIYNQIHKAIINGYTDICLFGTEICSYKTEEDKNLTELIKRILKDFHDITSIKLDTINPGYPDIDNLIDLINSEPKLQKELDLGIQSCSDRILKLMKRPYTLKHIEHTAEKAKGLDIQFQLITGFPGETEECFNETYEAVKRLKPSRITLCPFSARKNTKAYFMHNKVPNSIAKQGEEKLTELVKDSSGQKIENQNLAMFNKFQDREKECIVLKTVGLYSTDKFIEYFKYVQANNDGKTEFHVYCDFDWNKDIRDLDVNAKILITALSVKVFTVFTIDDKTIKTNFAKLITNHLTSFVRFEFKKLETASSEDIVNFFKANNECDFDRKALLKFIKAGNKKYIPALIKNNLLD